MGIGTRIAGALAAAALVAAPAQAQERPNILVIWGDDIGVWNVSAYSQGMMGYRTPNIDRIAREGVLFTDAYGQQSCTAGRAAFVTGQSPIRTGLLKVGLPGADLGLSTEDPTIATLLKAEGYATGQFGKNHLGDRDEFLPTNHGFDEFFGNLYHLNAEEEPENADYPRDMVMPDGQTFVQKFGPRGVIHSWADGRIEDTGPLTKKRMETIDYEVADIAEEFIRRNESAGTPWFVWFNTTRMHIWTHLRPEAEGKTGLGLVADGMTEHDGHVGRLLALLDELGITENTIVVYSTDNGAEVMSWPDGGTTPFRGEKNTNWEGGYRVPMMVRWPARIPAGQVVNDIIAQEDWLPTLMSAVGKPNIGPSLLNGATVGGKKYNVHLDGYDFMPLLLGQAESGPRSEFLYWTDDGQLANLRYGRWKVVFAEQRAESFDVWEEPFVTLRLPKLFDLRADPFERADHDGIGYDKWRLDRAYVLVPAQAYVQKWLTSFQKFPPRQKPASFNLDQVMASLTESTTSGR